MADKKKPKPTSKPGVSIKPKTGVTSKPGVSIKPKTS
jgi:hypothetical protein